MAKQQISAGKALIILISIAWSIIAILLFIYQAATIGFIADTANIGGNIGLMGYVMGGVSLLISSIFGAVPFLFFIGIVSLMGFIL
jgi:hypothetical protein